MKKTWTIILILFCVLAVIGCSMQEQADAAPISDEDPFTAEVMRYQSFNNKDFKRAVWISYLDQQSIVTADTGAYEDALETMLSNLALLRVTDVFFHVRSDGDSLAQSVLFPSAATTRYPDMDPDYDYVQTAVDAAHRHNIRIHAWVNPYRLQRSENATYNDFIAKLTETDARMVLSVGDALFLNPASTAARQLVVDGVRELIENYAFDGVHLDDYFYPATEPEMDETDYATYQTAGGALSLDDWRRDNVTALISDIYRAVKETDTDLVFGISPDGSIDRNRSRHYLDVHKICAEPGYVDYLCPQIYYGYQNETIPFLETLRAWSDLCTGCDLMIGLSFYKVGADDVYAGSGNQEWLERFDVISRQYLDCLAVENCVGVAFFRYDSLFRPAEAVSAYAEIEVYNL